MVLSHVAPAIVWRSVVLVATLRIALLGVPSGADRTVGASESSAMQPAPTVVAAAESTPQGAKVVVSGTDWPPRTAVVLSLSPPPGATEPVSLGTVQTTAAGALRATRLVPCSTSEPIAPDARVTVTARTEDGATVRELRISAAAWRCATL